MHDAHTTEILSARELEEIARTAAAAAGYLWLALRRKGTGARGWHEDDDAVQPVLDCLRRRVPALIASYSSLVKTLLHQPPPGYVAQRCGQVEARPSLGDGRVTGELICFVPEPEERPDRYPWVVEMDDGLWFPLPDGWSVRSAPRPPAAAGGTNAD